MSVTTTMGGTLDRSSSAGVAAGLGETLSAAATDAEDSPALRESRRAFAGLFAQFIWLNVPAVAGIAVLSGHGVLYSGILVALALVLAGVCQALRNGYAAAGARYGMSACGVGMAALVIAAAAGTRFQIDAHLYVFAMLAILVGWSDWRNIVFAVVLIAFHHGVLNGVAPWCVFPDGASYLRVAIHAVTVIVEAAVLVLISRQTPRLFAVAAAAERQAEERADAIARELLDARQEDIQVGEMMGSLIRVFRKDIRTCSETMKNDMQRLLETAHALSGTASEDNAVLEEVKAGASAVLAAMDEATRACHTLDETASDIRKRTANAANRVGDVQRQADQSSEAIARLSDGVTQLQEIVATISDVAAKTNLLALNATIEAARAGEAGRGFAVVASEVKGLAEQTAKATEVIGERISQITAETQSSVDEIRRIGQLAEAVRNDTRAIEEGIDAQYEATHSLDRTFESARDCANQSTRQVSRLAESMAETLHTAGVVESAVESLSGDTDRLYETIRSFLANVASSRTVRNET